MIKTLFERRKDFVNDYVSKALKGKKTTKAKTTKIMKKAWIKAKKTIKR